MLLIQIHIRQAIPVQIVVLTSDTDIVRYRHRALEALNLLATTFMRLYFQYLLCWIDLVTLRLHSQ